MTVTIDALRQFRFCKTCNRLQLMIRLYNPCWGEKKPTGIPKKGELLQCPGCYKECTA